MDCQDQAGILDGGNSNPVVRLEDIELKPKNHGSKFFYGFGLIFHYGSYLEQ